MSFAEAIKSVFNKYATFSGRSRRSEYWYFVLLNSIVSVLLKELYSSTDVRVFSVLLSVWSLAVLIPGFAVAIRRMHDIGKSGWALLINCIPLVGQIIWLVWAVRDSNYGDNQYGPNPKGNGSAPVV